MILQEIVRDYINLIGVNNKKFKKEKKKKKKKKWLISFYIKNYEICVPKMGTLAPNGLMCFA